MRTSVKKLVQRGLTTVAVVGATLATNPVPAGAAEGPTNWQHNICGSLGCTSPQGSLAALNQLKNEINLFSNLPLGIGIQESCNNQFDDFKSFLRGKNSLYWGAFYSQRSGSTICGNASPAGSEYGIGTYVLSQVDPYNYSGRVATGGFAAQTAGDEKRGFACIRGDVFGTPYWTCTSHHTPNGAQSQQFKEYHLNVIDPRDSIRVYWGGDLYVRPNDIPSASSTFSFSTHREGDLCLSGTNGYRWTFAGGSASSESDNSKFDYSFRSGPGAGNCPTDMRLRPTLETSMYPSHSSNSDHRVLGGYQPF